MKRIILLIFLIFLARCKDNKIELSEITFEKEHIALGNTVINKTLDFYIVINNPTDNSVLRILDIESSCDCTLLGKRKFNINPKSSDSIKINFKPKKKGYQEQSIVIKSNTKPPFTNIKISAMVN